MPIRVEEKRKRRTKRPRKGPTGLGGLGSGTGRRSPGPFAAPSPGKDFGDQMEDRRLPRDYQRQSMTDEDLRKRLKQRPISRLTGGQAKIAAKAPPRNKIDKKDFAVLRAEKAKGRGMGLQDEKMKPGKVMKANSGDMANKKNFRGFSKVFQGPQDKGRVATISGTKPTLRANSKAAKAARFALKAARATTIGKIALGVAAAGLGAKEYLKRKMKKNEEKAKAKKKMGGGMMKKVPGYKKGSLNQGTFSIGPFKPKPGGAKPSLDYYDEKKKKKMMGGGMMMRPNPMGYKKGVLVKVKLGRNKPTKMY